MDEGTRIRQKGDGQENKACMWLRERGVGLAACRLLAAFRLLAACRLAVGWWLLVVGS